MNDFATSRLRAKYVVELLADDPFWEVDDGYDPDADVAVIVQLCSDQTFREISANRDQFVIYDICDRFFETDNTFRTEEGPLRARSRCLETIDRANLLIAPSLQLRDEVQARFPGKPCFHIPELIDYGGIPSPVTAMGSRRVLWFGHPRRGNFESARWIIDHLASHHGYEPVLVTNRRAVARQYPAYARYCVGWSPEATLAAMTASELCVVSHAPEERSKSPNRFVTATMHGVPTLVSGSPSCSEILEAAGYGEFEIDVTQDIDHAVEMLSDTARRAAYVADLQDEMWKRHAPSVVRDKYLELLQMILRFRHSMFDD
jgi:glycosyltransferase involved in cell wall biosynthesis